MAPPYNYLTMFGVNQNEDYCFFRIPDYKIATEIDEHGHKDRDQIYRTIKNY